MVLVKMRKFGVLILFLFLPAILFPQKKASFTDLKNEYDSFEFQKAIRIAGELLQSKDSLSSSVIIDIYIMKAVSHYTLTEEPEAKNCFFEILKINRNYKPDPEKVPPKIINLFSEIRKDYLQLVPETAKIPETKTEVTKTEEPPKTIIKEVHIPMDSEYRSAISKSLILPGWGHFSVGSSTKGWLFSVASAVSIGTMIYFIINTNNKEKSYIAETDLDLIRSKYDSYNTSYKLRNVFIVTSVALWTYTQLDLLLWDVNEYSKIGLSMQKNPAFNNNLNWCVSGRIAF